MKKILTIDFDIIMHPCIDIYNDADISVDEYLNTYDFLGWMAADLELYKTLTEFLFSVNPNKIFFIYDHHEIVDKIEEKVNLYNIDYHHDIGYGTDMRWHAPLARYHEGNWVKKLTDDDKINNYIWLKDYKSSDVADEGSKYLTEQHYIYNFNLTELADVDEIYISLSPDWVPSYYRYLYDIWQDLIYNK